MSQKLIDEINALIRDVPDFPKPGIIFKDITTVIQSGPAFLKIIDYFKARYAGRDIQRIVGIESRGFIFGAAIAYSLGMGFGLVRKPGKLPWKTESAEYDLEYGSDAVEMHIDTVAPGDNVVIIDDLLATGGTAKATVDLVERLGATVTECAFVFELGFLPGREKLDRPTHSLVVF